MAGAGRQDRPAPCLFRPRAGGRRAVADLGLSLWCGGIRPGACRLRALLSRFSVKGASMTGEVSFIMRRAACGVRCLAASGAAILTGDRRMPRFRAMAIGRKAAAQQPAVRERCLPGPVAEMDRPSVRMPCKPRFCTFSALAFPEGRASGLRPPLCGAFSSEWQSALVRRIWKAPFYTRARCVRLIGAWSSPRGT